MEKLVINGTYIDPLHMPFDAIKIYELKLPETDTSVISQHFVINSHIARTYQNVG